MKHYHTFLNSTCALALGALMTAGLSGCAATELVDEPGNAPSELGDVTVIATLGQGVGTRTGHEESIDGTKVVKVSWAPGDDINILSLDAHGSITSVTTFAFAGMTEDGASGIFKGKAEPGSSAKGYAVIYPARATPGAVRPMLDMTGQTQWGDNNMAHLGAYDVLFATKVSDWKSFSFAGESYHLNALMTFDLKDIPAGLGRPQSITLGCTGANKVFYKNTWNIDNTFKVSTLGLKLTGFATPTEGATTDIKAYMMMAGTTIPKGESLTITVKGDKGSYIFTSAPMVADKSYYAGNRYTATASTWEKVYSDFTYTGAEPAEAFTGGGASAADPYVIGTPGQLRTLIEEVNRDKNFSTGKFFRLAANIDIKMAAGTNWTPIGVSNYSFCGTFDGDGHTISGTMAGSGNNIGFFGYIKNGATIRNLTVDAAVSGDENVGGIAGGSPMNGNSSYIINCVNKGTVTATGEFVGGIIGDASTTHIIGCVNQGNISGQASCGGIAGYTSKYAITACYNTGKIMSADGSTKQMGAIVGRANLESIISYCQYVPDAANTGLPVFGTNSSGSHSNNDQRADLAALNGDGVTALNAGITVWNNAHHTQPCSFEFVAGTGGAGPQFVPAVIPD